MTDRVKKRIEKELEEKTGKLDLSYAELDRIPEEVGKMVWLTELYLSSNQLGKLEGLEGLSSLTTLYLSSNQLSKLEGLEGLSSLTALDLFNNQLSKLEGLEGLSSLTTLDLNSNQLSKLEGLEGLSSLTTLDLNSNQLSKLEGLEGLSSLTELYLSSNQLSKLEGLEGLSSLTELYLSSNQLSKLEGLEGLSSLTMLDLNSNQLSKLEGLEGLSSLTALYLSSNQLSKLEGLEGLSSLTTLDLSSNQLSKLEGLEGLSSLTALDLSSNQLSKLEGLEGLSSLTTLDLNSNQLSKLEGLEGLSSLTALYLASNQLSKLEGLDKLSNLEALFLQNNEIEQIAGLTSLYNLKVLDFEDNPIIELPIESQTFLCTIPFLDLKRTKIKDLRFFEQSIQQGKKILWEDIEYQSGEVSNNRDYALYSVGKRIFHVKRGINVKDCEYLQPELVAAIQAGSEALLAYINEPREPLFEARVLVLGEPRAGKTTLRRKLIDVGSAMPSEQESTKAFEIEVDPYECEIEYKAQKEKLRYYLWDFGGQDYYRLLHQLFVAEQSVYIIVVDTDRNKNEEEIEFWLNTIEWLGRDEQNRYGPVILLQNPKNKRPGGEFSSLKSDYPFWQQNKDFIINLNALNKAAPSFDQAQLTAFRDFEKYLSESFCQLKHVGKEIPTKWVAVREALLIEKVNWITIERFYEICDEKKITSKAQQIDILNIFRQLGYLLHYKNSALKNMVILNKEWVTDALYRVLDDPIVEANKGWFKIEDAEKIWHEEKYKNRTKELLALMQEFKLCYQNLTTKKYIVPSKLPSSTNNLPTWNASNNVRLRLEYDWMPKAIVIQLLVSLHEYIVPLPKGEHWIWRKGAVLNGEQLDLSDVQVRIKEQEDDKRIAIDARGKHSETLFRTIMKKWREVNEPFKDKVEVSSIILCPCPICVEAKKPFEFEYQDVLSAKEEQDTLRCNKARKDLAASDILKGVYDETTVLIDSLEAHNNKHSGALDLIKADELGEAIATITSPKYNVLFTRRLEELERNTHAGTLSFEQKNQARNILAQDLVDYFTSDLGRTKQKLERLERFSTDREAFAGESEETDKSSEEDISASKKEQPSVQAIINNNSPETHSTSQPTPSEIKTPTETKVQVSGKQPIYQQWWFGRILVAIIGGCVVGYFASKYFGLHFGDTWLGTSSLAAVILLLRNPKRAYLRWAGFCVMAIAGINVLSQIDVALKITDTTEEKRPWDFLFKLGFGEEPIISVILGILAAVLFILDYRMRKGNP